MVNVTSNNIMLQIKRVLDPLNAVLFAYKSTKLYSYSLAKLTYKFYYIYIYDLNNRIRFCRWCDA